MTGKITYLIGAGASANSIPIVEGFLTDPKKGMKSVISALEYLDIKLEKFASGNLPNTNKKEQLDRFMKDVSTTVKKIEDEHTTIDNYARMLFLTQEIEELKRLKAILTFYLILVQLENTYDKRYDLFLSTILRLDENRNLSLPKSIQIISWNYDFQFELAGAKYFDTNRISNIQRLLNTSSVEVSNQFLEDKFSITKLNGTSIGYYNPEGRFHDFAIQFDRHTRYKEETIEKCLLYYNWFMGGNENIWPAIEFAWESSVHTEKVRATCNQKAANTEILVIIGYSFPTFNRTIDKSILSNMRGLKSVYIQTMRGSLNEVTERFKSLIGSDLLNDVGIYPVPMESGKEEFYIPFDFTGE